MVRVARGERCERTPVWVMRQAGRYLPEYRETRASLSSFFELCRSPQKVREVTLQPIDRFGLDAAIIFSDILVVPQALGMRVEMVAGVGPVLPEPLVDGADMQKRLNDAEHVCAELEYVYEGVRLTAEALRERDVPLIGFCGAPWTLMCYMVEGGGSKTFSKAKAWLFERPESAHRLLATLADAAARHLIGQARAGASLLMVFDSWAGLLGGDEFDEFCLPYLKRIAEALREALPGGAQRVPLIVFAKGAHYALEALAVGTLYDVVGLDWTMRADHARARVDAALRAAGIERSVVLQGNMDPCALYGDRASIERRVRAMLDRFAPPHAHIANLGHGMHPDHNPEHLRYFIDEIHRYSEEHSSRQKIE
jgi:uroporphyrinogen decarboxylase